VFAVTEGEKKQNKRKQLFTFSAKYGAVPVENSNYRQETDYILEKENEKQKNTNGEIADKPVTKKLRLFKHPENVKGKSLLQMKNTTSTEPQPSPDLKTTIFQVSPLIPNQLNHLVLPLLPKSPINPKLPDENIEFPIQLKSSSPINIEEKFLPVQVSESITSFKETKLVTVNAHMPSTITSPVKYTPGRLPKHTILQSTKQVHVDKVAVNLLKSFSAIPKRDEHLNSSFSSTSDSGYVSAEYSKQTYVMAKCSRPFPTIFPISPPSSEELPQTQLLTTPSKTKKKLLSKTASPTKRKKQPLKSSNKSKDIPPIKHRKHCEESLAVGRNEFEVKRIASFDDTEQLEDYLFSQKKQNTATAKKSTKARSIILEKKIAREKHQESCKTYRANK